MEIELRQLVGHRVIVKGPNFLDSEKLPSVKLLAVEETGIWIESQEAMDKLGWEFVQETFGGGACLLHSLWTNCDHRGGF